VKERDRRREADLLARVVPGGMSSWVKDSFSGPAVWCVKVADDLIDKVKASDVVSVQNNAGDITHEVLELECDAAGVWEVEQ